MGLFDWFFDTESTDNGFSRLRPYGVPILEGEPDPLREAVRAELRGAPKPQNDKPWVYFMADGADASREFERVASGLRALSNSGVRMGHAPLPSPPIIECRYCGTQYHVGESRNCVNCGAPLPLR